MSPFRPSRDRRGDDRFLIWKMLLFTTGAATAFYGMATGNDRLVVVAIVILALGFLLRFASRRRD